MIQITIQPEAIRFEGHAGYAPAGQDIVCAAVSALYHTLALNLRDRPGFVGDGIPSGAQARIACPGARAEIAFVARGLRAVAESYPAHVRVREETT